jgi:ABC-type antimicrobial peptide transport system permease subunit
MDYRARAVLLGLIGAMCLPLAIAGIAGAATHAVRQRMREIGIRMALGAEPGRIGRDVAAPIALVIGSGLALGVAGGWAMGRLMSAYLFGVGAASLSGFAAAALVLVLAGAAGAALPLRRALRIQPAQALREA